jgi:hypothetical protein
VAGGQNGRHHIVVGVCWWCWPWSLRAASLPVRTVRLLLVVNENRRKLKYTINCKVKLKYTMMYSKNSSEYF